MLLTQIQMDNLKVFYMEDHTLAEWEDYRERFIELIEDSEIVRQSRAEGWDAAVDHIATKVGYGWQERFKAENPYRKNNAVAVQPQEK